MPSTFTPNLRLTKQGDNENASTWGQILNQNVIDLIDEAISGVASINITGSSTVNIATGVVNGGSDNARHAVLKLTGTLGANIDFVIPALEKIYAFDNTSTGGDVSVKAVGGTLSVVLTPGKRAIIYCDGAEVYLVADVTPPVDALIRTNNLSDVPNKATGRTNLDVYSKAETDAAITTGTNNTLALAAPAGAVMAFARNTPPTGWLACNGQAVSRTTFATLFAAIGTTFGTGDGSTTFNLPEMRGEFVRGWDNGRGIDSGRVFGSTQLDQMQTITGSFTILNRGGGAAGESAFKAFTGAFNAVSGGGSFGTGWQGEAGSQSTTLSFTSSASPGARTGTETRARNVALLYCIKT